MGFFGTVKKQYKKGRKMLEDYQEGAAERDRMATERFKKKTKLLKEKTKLQKAKAEYKKAKGGGKSLFEGKSMFGDMKEPKRMSWSIGNDTKGAMANSWSVGSSIEASKPKKKRAKKPKYKKVVYYR